MIYWCENYSDDITHISRSKKKFQVGKRRLLYALIRSSRALSSLGWTVSAPLAFPHMSDAYHVHGLLLDSLHYVYVSLVMRGSELYPTLQMGLTSSGQRGRITFLILLATPCLMQPKRLLVFAVTALCWLMVNFISPGLPGPSLLSSWLPPPCAVPAREHMK